MNGGSRREVLEKLDDMIVRQAEATGAQVAAAKAAIGNVIFGQEKVVEQALITVLCGGHALLIGLPGLAKTKLVETMGIVLGLDARRIQFTPDLMPSDIVGSEVLEESPGGKRSFRFIPGPIFGQLLMADEINRASPRTQSALLQAMQEHHVTVAGNRHDVPRPFHVLATQNPIEQEGTYPLPEAQLDRFLMQIDVDYPDHAAERKIVFDTTGAEESKPKPTMTADELIAAQRLVRRLPVGESVVEAILNLVRSARPGPETGDIGKLISWGPSPRASQALMLVARARALIDGRLVALDRRRARRWPSRSSSTAWRSPSRRAPTARAPRPSSASSRRASDELMAAKRRADRNEIRATQRASGEARALAETHAAPDPESRRIAATVIHGLHGRRRAGPGENFWQYRRFLSGEPARRVDWRRSARDEHLYVREQEWEAAHTVWIWADRSPSMLFTSQLAQESKLDRTLVVAFALAEMLVQAGERVGMPGLMRPTGSRNVLDKMANAIVHDVTERASLPPAFAPSALAEIVVVSDFWSPMAEMRAMLAQLSSTGAHGHTVQIVDPAEETFPYSGRVEFIEPEGAGSITAGRAEAWKADYEARVARHRAEIRAETDKLGWSFAIHRTDRPATELLLALHARMGAPPPGRAVGRAQPPAGVPPDRRRPGGSA